jgi:hypothetical protein
VCLTYKCLTYKCLTYKCLTYKCLTYKCPTYVYVISEPLLRHFTYPVKTRLNAYFLCIHTVIGEK